MCFFLKPDTIWLQTKPAKCLVTIVWAQTAKKKKKKKWDQASESQVVFSCQHDHVEVQRVFLRLLVTYCLGKAEFEWRCRSRCLPIAQRVIPSRKPSSDTPALPHHNMRLHCHSFLVNTKMTFRQLVRICPVKNRRVYGIMTVYRLWQYTGPWQSIGRDIHSLETFSPGSIHTYPFSWWNKPKTNGVKPSGTRWKGILTTRLNTHTQLPNSLPILSSLTFFSFKMLETVLIALINDLQGRMWTDLQANLDHDIWLYVARKCHWMTAKLMRPMKDAWLIMRMRSITRPSPDDLQPRLRVNHSLACSCWRHADDMLVWSRACHPQPFNFDFNFLLVFKLTTPRSTHALNCTGPRSVIWVYR